MLRGSNPAKVQQWTDRLARFQKSNLKVPAFCRNEGVSVPSFYQWKKRLASKTIASENKRGGGKIPSISDPAHQHAKTTAGPAFQSVEILPTAAGQANPSVTTIRLPHGIEIELGSDLRVVELLIKQLLDRSADSKGGRQC